MITYFYTDFYYLFFFILVRFILIFSRFKKMSTIVMEVYTSFTQYLIPSFFFDQNILISLWEFTFLLSQSLNLGKHLTPDPGVRIKMQILPLWLEWFKDVNQNKFRASKDTYQELQGEVLSLVWWEDMRSGLNGSFYYY